jgi:hypothetical protein
MGIMEWDQVSQGRPGGQWLVATEKGLGVMAAWAAGTVNVQKMPVDDRGRTVGAQCHDPDGHVRAWTEPFTVADRELVDEEIESYLLDAGVPLPPWGWVWLIRRPVTFRDAPPARHGGALRRRLRTDQAHPGVPAASS